MIEMPAVNGTARSIAKLYGSAATGGVELGLTATTLDALHNPALPPSNGLRDKVLHVDTTFSLGFNKPVPLCIFGSTDNAFGTPGAGGVVRLRRTRHRHRVRLCDEPSGLPFGQ